MIRAKVNIETAKKRYAPGEVIMEWLPDTDMEFLKKHGFIIEESLDPEGGAIGLEECGAIRVSEIQDPEEESSEEPVEYKDENALKKMYKDEIVEYAKRIGLTIDQNMSKNDMIDAVLNHIGEISEAQERI